MKVTLYSTNCPKCNILKAKLNAKGVDFIENNDINLMISRGFTSSPMLEVDNEVMNFTNANKWINERN